MLISHRYKFIFLRTEKTAGSSLSSAIVDALGDDVIAPNMTRPKWAKFSPIHHGALKRSFPRFFGFHSHSTARQARHVLGREIFDSYYKFAVERNPWARQVSLYTHREWKKNKPGDQFDKHLRSWIYRNTEYVRLNNWSIYAIGNKVVVDELLRYETLSEQLTGLFKKLGVKNPIKLPNLRQYKTGRTHYSKYYSDASRDLVAKWYSKEIEACDYVFEAQ